MKAFVAAKEFDDATCLHAWANIANMLAKENKQFFRLKGKILEALARSHDGLCIRLYADRQEGVVFVYSSHLGLTSFHYDPSALEKNATHRLCDASFAWSGFERQKMAVTELLEPELLERNRAASLKIKKKE
jgi:hypothetical protein